MTMGDNNAIHEGNKFSNCSSSTTTLSPRNSDLLTNHNNNNLWLFTIHSLHDDDDDDDDDDSGGDDVKKHNLGPINGDGDDAKSDLKAMDDDDKDQNFGAIATNYEVPGVDYNRNGANNKGIRGDKPMMVHFDDLMMVDKPRLPINVVLDKPHKSQDQGWASIRALRRRLGPDIPLGIGHFKLLERVGHGDIGTVFLAQLRGTSHCFFAIKVMDKEALSHRKKLERMYREREILGFLDHPFLPTLYAHFEAEKFSCLVMDFCPGGDLHALRQKQPAKRFGLKAARFYAAEVLLALEYLHMLGIVYRDLKPENVLVREDGHIMLTDFDLSLKCEVEPKLSRCPLSTSTSTSGRFSQFMRSFSVSSSVASSLPSTPIVGHTSLDCMVGSASCTIHPFLSCLPISGTASALTRIKARQGHTKHRKSLFSMLFNSKHAGYGSKSKASSRTPRAGEVRASKDMMALSSSEMNTNNVECIGVKDGAKDTIDRLHRDMVLDGSDMVDIDMEEDVMMRASNVCRDEIPMGVELIAEPTEARSMSFVGTHEYLAPEMIDGRGHGNAVDWWTFGIFLYELLYGKTPFKGAKNEHTLVNIVKQPLRFPEWGGHVDPGEHAKTLIEGLLEKLPSQRLGSIKGAAEIKQHPFFRGVNWALIRSAEPPEVPNFGGSRLSAQYHHQQQQQQHHQQDDLKTKVFTRTPSKAASHFDYF